MNILVLVLGIRKTPATAPLSNFNVCRNPCVSFLSPFLLSHLALFYFVISSRYICIPFIPRNRLAGFQDIHGIPLQIEAQSFMLRVKKMAERVPTVINYIQRVKGIRFTRNLWLKLIFKSNIHDNVKWIMDYKDWNKSGKSVPLSWVLGKWIRIFVLYYFPPSNF